MHFDLVVKYSHGRLPRGKETISPDSATYIALFSSCAYFGTPDKFPGGVMPPPPWTERPEKMRQDLALNSAAWRSLENYEVSQPPLYYALTGVVWRAGQWLKMDAGRLLYSLRFLNVALVVTLVWLGYFTARTIFPENCFLWLGVPTLIAFLPQTAFYSIGNDVVSPLCFGVAFLFLLKWLSSEKPSMLTCSATGLAFAATYLSKTTNLPFLMVALAVLLFKAGQRGRHQTLRATSIPLLAFFGCAALPVLAWMIWCKLSFGDYTGSKLKMEHFGWTVKPFPEWWHHPIFSPAGLWTYLSGQLATFWQGEFLWHSRPLALPGSNVVYTILSLLLPLAALSAFKSPSKGTPLQRQALGLSIVCFATGLIFFAFLSIVYDFHDCPNPSREHPYFQAGRMLLGGLIPFLLLFVYGMDRALERFGNATKFITLAVLIFAMFISEIATDWPAFSNPYNWFHLP